MKPFAKTEIRAATRDDLPQIVHVWQTVFGDSEAYIRFFLDNRCALPHTLVYTQSSVVVSQLFLLSAKLKAAEKIFSVYYLFAAATLPQYRGQGYMGDLLRAAQQKCLAEKSDGIVLLPAGDGLYRYYERFGFQEAFSRKVWHGSREALAPFAAAASCDPAQAKAFLLRDQQTRDGILWSEPSLDYALREQAKFRGAYTAADASAFAAVGEECFLLSAPENFGKGVHALLSLTTENELTLILPADAPVGCLQKGGMLWSARQTIPLENAFLSFPME